MAFNGFKVMDSDMHVQEPADLWTRYIEPKYRDQAPVGTNNYLGDQDLVHEGRVISRFRVQAPYQGGMTDWFTDHYGRREIYEDFDRRGWDGKCQLEAMDAEGIDVGVLYPTRGLFAHAKEYDDDGFAAAISRAYNNWLAGMCAVDPKRMYGAAMLPAQDIQAAIAEVKRAREELGFIAVSCAPIPYAAGTGTIPVTTRYGRRARNTAWRSGFTKARRASFRSRWATASRAFTPICG